MRSSSGITFLDVSRDDVKTTEDRVHALFVQAATIASSRHQKEMQSRLECQQGNDLLTEWLAVSCSYNGETSMAFAGLLLLLLQQCARHFSSVVKKLAKYRST
ncbi:hypothetical protein F444_08807 [Phytophthora nicotianae P1976]|uniref:Uncharacterized protein n=1 Tax=Phytophthora nicotianae P1976 TaxID=1317066 RepID=A0A081A9S5_PHYNI|nr:hypothetical protein F444_08807 [Phytophthora nicotianae P1976]